MVPAARFACLALFTCALVLPSSARATHWTAVASSGVIDEANLTPAVNFVFNGPSLQFANGVIGTITARYNVTSSVDFPPWAQLELGAFDSSTASSVSASLIRVRPCDGQQVTICTAFSSDGTAPACTSCTIPVAIDFTQFLYYVEVRVNRTTAGVFPRAITLRLLPP